jgi:hypothetical protein
MNPPPDDPGRARADNGGMEPAASDNPDRPGSPDPADRPNQAPPAPGSQADPDSLRLAESMAAPLVAPTRPPPEPPPRPDPWAHRRGEPRVFALLWTIFLFGATALTMLLTVARGFPGPEIMRPAARTMLITVAVGVAVVWPLFRLSQRRDERPVAGMVHDLVVIIVPIQAIVWPQTLWWLGRWPVEVVAAVAASLTAWCMVVGGLLAFAYASEAAAWADPSPRTVRDMLRRAGWMTRILAVTVAPAALALIPGDADARWWWMFSPISAAAELVRDRAWSGITAAVHPLHWWMTVGTALLSLPVWFAAGSLAERGHSPGGRRYAPGLD